MYLWVAHNSIKWWYHIKRLLLYHFEEGHATTYFSKSRKINLKQHENYEEQQNNGLWTFKFCQTRWVVSFSSQLGTEKQHLLWKLKCLIKPNYVPFLQITVNKLSSNLQARMKCSKPAGNGWGTPFWGTARGCSSFECTPYIRIPLWLWFVILYIHNPAKALMHYRLLLFRQEVFTSMHYFLIYIMARPVYFDSASWKCHLLRDRKWRTGSGYIILPNSCYFSGYYLFSYIWVLTCYLTLQTS